MALTLTRLGLGERSEVRRPAPARPRAPTAEQQALQAGRRALEAWGRFAVTNRLSTLRRWFWTTSPRLSATFRSSG